MSSTFIFAKARLTIGTLTLTTILVSCGGAAASTSSTTSTGGVTRVANITLLPDTVTMSVGGSTTLTATAYDANGAVIPDAIMAWSGNEHNGELTAVISGTYSNVGTFTAHAPVVATVNASSGTRAGTSVITVH